MYETFNVQEYASKSVKTRIKQLHQICVYMVYGDDTDEIEQKVS